MQSSSETSPLWIPVSVSSTVPSHLHDQRRAEAPAPSQAAAAEAAYATRWTQLHPVAAETICHPVKNGSSVPAACPMLLTAPPIQVRGDLAPWLTKASAAGLYVLQMADTSTMQVRYSSTCDISVIVHSRCGRPRLEDIT